MPPFLLSPFLLFPCLNPAAWVLRHQWDQFLVDKGLEKGAGTNAWDKGLVARQEMLVLERLIKTSAMENTWKVQAPEWKQQVACATDHGTQQYLLNELLSKLRPNALPEFVWASLDEYDTMKDKVKHARFVLMQASALYGGAKSCTMAELANGGGNNADKTADVVDDTAKLPNRYRVKQNWNGALEYSRAFPVKIQHLSTARPLMPWYQHGEEHPQGSTDMVDSDEVEFVTIDVGCGVGSVMWAGHKIEEWLLSCDVDSERGVKVKMVYCCFEIDPDALSVLQKWFATRITNGQVKLCGNMHEFSGVLHKTGVIIHSVWMSIACTHICGPGLQVDVGDVEATVNLLVDPTNWCSRDKGVGETHRQIQSTLRIINFALESNPSVMVNFENVQSMPPAVQAGIFKVYDGVARFHTVLNEADFSGVQRCRLRWGTHFVPAARQMGGPKSMWQTYLGNPEAGGMVAGAAKATCVTQASQHTHYETEALPEPCVSGRQRGTALVECDIPCCR